jgi:CheY-like chemotaxis protein
MPKAGRIRVLIAGNVYVKRALVRRFLEDDGYAVVGDVMSADAVIPAVRAGQPDAVVLDEDLASHGAGIEAIRGAAADVRVIVFTAAATGTGAPPPGADGYLDKGVGLSALTALLGRLFFEPTAPLEPPMVGATTGMPPSPVTAPEPVDDAAGAGSRPVRRSAVANVSRMVAMAAGVLLLVWGVAAAIRGSDIGGDSTNLAEASSSPSGGEVVEPGSPSLLDEAYATLDRLVEALRDGNYVVGTVEAQALVDQRDEAVAAGFAIAGFDAEVTSRLLAIAPNLPERVNVQLADTLGSLYPPIQAPTGSTGGTDGTTTTGAGDGTSTGTSTGGTDGSGGGDTSTGGADGSGGGETRTGGTGTSGGDGGGQDAGPLDPVPQPGDGKAWGWSHKPPHGGWHGNKPPK